MRQENYILKLILTNKYILAIVSLENVQSGDLFSIEWARKFQELTHDIQLEKPLYLGTRSSRVSRQRVD